jgi:hypothetical protein
LRLSDTHLLLVLLHTKATQSTRRSQLLLQTLKPKPRTKLSRLLRQLLPGQTILRPLRWLACANWDNPCC